MAGLAIWSNVRLAAPEYAGTLDLGKPDEAGSQKIVANSGAPASDFDGPGSGAASDVKISD
jgi:hypothetical protein